MLDQKARCGIRSLFAGHALSKRHRRAKRRAIADAAQCSVERLEERLVLSCPCSASLFAGPRLVSVDSTQSALLEGVFNALLPGSHVDLTVADWNAVAIGDVGVSGLLPALEA